MALYPASNDSAYNLWRKILTNQNGAETYFPGEPEHSIKKKIVRNQGGPNLPASNDTERTTLAKMLRNQIYAIENTCSGIALASSVSSNDTETTILAKLLRNQEASNSYTLGIADVPILKLILGNMAAAIDAGGDAAQIAKVFVPCASTPPPPVVPMKLVLPLVTRYAIRVGGTTSDVRFKGTVTLFDDGHYEFDGQCGGFAVANQFKVWVGSSPTVGAYQNLFLSGNNAYIAVSATVTPGVGEKVYLIFGDEQNVGYRSNILAFDYPDGFVSPLEWVIGGSVGSPAFPSAPYVRHILTRNGNNIDSDFTYQANSSVGFFYNYTLYEISTLTEGGFNIIYNSTGSIANKLDSFVTNADNNLGLMIQSGTAQSGTNQRWGIGHIGPFIRTPPVPIPV